VYELVDTCGVYELVDVIYICYLLLHVVLSYIYMFVNVERKKQNVASLPSRAVGKGAFAESSGQLRSATLEKFSQLRCSQLC
jgi:hypothetical protein